MPDAPPFFPSWQSPFAPRGRRLAQTSQTVRAYTLSQLEERLGPYLPPTLFPKAADQRAPSLPLLQGRPVKIAEGSTLTTPDTPQNRPAYPPVQTPEPNFPRRRARGLFSRLSGAILNVVLGDWHTAELPMLYQRFNLLVPNDILMGDRGLGN